ncbi:MAG: hypothetical protein ACXWMS_08375, partial [Syntrophales bacterium]
SGNSMISDKLKDRLHCGRRARHCLLPLIMTLFYLNCSNVWGGVSDLPVSNVKNVHYVDSVGTNFLFRGE